MPDDKALEKLAGDYKNMVADGLFLDDAESFDAMIKKCLVIQNRANKL